MAGRYDVVVIGSGLGGLVAAARLAKAGRKVLVIERNNSVGGASSTYKVGDLVVEASLHETADPHHPLEPKHHVLAELGVLDAVQWIAAPSLYEVRGGPVGAAFTLPEGFAEAGAALAERFPGSRRGLSNLLGEMERISEGLGRLSRGSAAFADPREGLGALLKLAPALRHWQASLADRLQHHLGEDEAAKCGLAANLAYYHDDPDRLWWVFFAAAQGGFLQSGGRFVRGGSQRLSSAIARVIRQAGGEVLTRRRATAIAPGADGAPHRITHVARDGSDPAEVAGEVLLANAAPGVVADLLPEPMRTRFAEAFAGRERSISLFTLTLGLDRPAAAFGLTSYSTVLLPDWMRRHGEFRRGADILAGLPGAEMPPLVVVDYSRIDSGLGGPPHPLAVVGVDRVANWQLPDAAAHDDKRARWQAALIAALDRQFPGIAGAVTATSFTTALSMSRYLNQPGGAVYGFAPLPPTSAVWRGYQRSPDTPIENLFLASAYAGAGGFTGAVMAGAAAAERVLATPRARAGEEEALPA